jgi:hypothetical protein
VLLEGALLGSAAPEVLLPELPELPELLPSAEMEAAALSALALAAARTP